MNLDQELSLRLIAFLAVYLLMVVLETILPRRSRREPMLLHSSRNLGLLAVGSVLARLASAVVIVLPVSAALYAEQRGWGLFRMIEWPQGLEWLIIILVFDLAIYWQHVAFHHIPILWRLHRVHHSDVELDASSGLRFHPIEILLSLMIKSAVAVLLGAPAAAVVLFEILLNATSIFNHANMKLPLGLDRLIRKLIVTPDMHRVHHSTIVAETNSNFGFNFVFWDRLFKSYRDQPELGHDEMNLGTDATGVRPLSLGALLLLPFRRQG